MVASKLAHAVANKVRGAREAVVDYYFDALASKLHSALLKVSDEDANNPWTPRWFVELKRALNKQVVDGILVAFHDLDELKYLRKWSRQVGSWPAPPNFRQRPLQWIRAKLLYSLMPADKPIWWVMQQPAAIIVILLSFIPFAVCILPTTLVFFLMDRSDEYQVALFLCTLKTIFWLQRLVIGIVGLVQLYWSNTTTVCDLNRGPGVSDFEQLAVLTLLPMQFFSLWASLNYATLRLTRQLAAERKWEAHTKENRGVRRFTQPDEVLQLQWPLGKRAVDPSSRGQLIVHVVSATQLLARDRGGTSDPFVTLTLGSKKHRTRILKKTTEPKWDSRFGFDGVLGDLIAEGPLHCRVWDYDVGSTNDYLGEAQFSLKALLDKEHIAFPNAELHGVSAGKITLSVTWRPDDYSNDPSSCARLAASGPPAAAEARNTADVEQGGAGKVQVHLLHASGLLAKDRSGKSDPFVEASVGSSLKTSTTIKQTLDPIWDQRLKFRCELADLKENPVLRLKVWDRDRFLFKEYLGECAVSLEPLLRGEDVEVNCASLGDGRGTISAVASWLANNSTSLPSPTRTARAIARERGSVDKGELVRPSRDSVLLDPRTSLAAWRRPDPNRHGKIEVRIERAKELVAKDWDGASDPFVEVQHGLHGRKHRTDTIENTLNPVWKDEVFTFPGLLSELVMMPLLIRVWDYDAVSPNDFLGDLEIDMRGLLERFVLDVVDEPLAGVKTGMLTCSIKWEADTDEAPPPIASKWFRAIPSQLQRSRVRRRPLGRVIIWDIVGSATLAALLSIDLLYRVRGHTEWHAPISALFSLWCDFYTFNTSATERRLAWFFSTFGFGVIALPFVFFSLPLLGRKLLGLQLTGYDQGGNLRLVMSNAEMVDKYEREQELLSKDQKALDKQRAKAGARKPLIPSSSRNQQRARYSDHYRTLH